ncbi:phosphodiesterase/alkaline phosphatase D-like protein [Stackebrandtia albiflava]|uniref:Phosphodiesterase/alkaline phosphatase D-like protein n=1 Tax=Stackebrandtia albiflava TaxID=406432 RepID=A0A562VB86_9ACTN|nr:alkaline phosphatase D family protein [Stackebrandtia albiflava]TWJ15108.1 phosphodiesterase/alkaline phosphatase D-like protein [Stackebrandtia albiflava]
MAELVLGPVLRHVDQTSATIWVETDRPCRVTVSGHEADTFTVHGHHYALVDVTGLSPGSTTVYGVDLDGRTVWPVEGASVPPSVIRTLHDGPGTRRLLFGSCRTSVPHEPAYVLTHGVDMLRAYALQMRRPEAAPWPDSLALLGDQVYADEPPEAVRRFIRERRDVTEPPGHEVLDFEEYAELYRVAWSDPEVRWLMSTVPVMMIFDDHDLRDDWNTSQTWQDEMRTESWWRRRVTAGIGAYWVYQHAGNLSPAERAADPMMRLLGPTGDHGDELDRFAWECDQDPSGYRWSYLRDFGDSRLIMLDSRCARTLTPGDRRMIDDAEWEWFVDATRGEFSHLFVGSSLPVLLPSGVHYVESWNEALSDGVWGRRAARFAEWLRQTIDLEHWSAFRRSFDDMAALVTAIIRGEHGTPPANIVFLSGDVHYSYLAHARIRRSRGSVYQVVCSPIRNPLNMVMRVANAVAQTVVAGLLGRALALTAGVRKSRFGWRMSRGPWFSNSMATLEFDGEDTVVHWHTSGKNPNWDDPWLAVMARQELGGRKRPRLRRLRERVGRSGAGVS